MQQNECDDPAIAPIRPALAGPQRWPGRPPLSLTLDRGTDQEPIWTVSWASSSSPAAAPRSGVVIGAQGGLLCSRAALGAFSAVVRYWVDPADDTMHPLWATTNLPSRFGRGRATRKAGKPGAFAGQWEIIYTQSGQELPPLQLDITERNEGFGLSWSSSGSQPEFQGVGLVRDSELLVAWAALSTPVDMVFLAVSSSDPPRPAGSQVIPFGDLARG